ncbi:hypothetical protein V6N12_057147 [Hibiscus sabdariffa]
MFTLDLVHHVGMDKTDVGSPEILQSGSMRCGPDGVTDVTLELVGNKTDVVDKSSQVSVHLESCMNLSLRLPHNRPNVVEQPTEFPLWSMSISSLATQMQLNRSNNLEDVPADTLSLRLWMAKAISRFANGFANKLVKSGIARVEPLEWMAQT